MSALSDILRGPLQGLLGLASSPVTYQQQGGQAATIRAFVRGIRSDDLFASAMQQDVAAVINADEYAQAFPVRPIPSRYDRLRTATVSYAVEEWRGAPSDDKPVVYKLLLRGGQQ